MKSGVFIIITSWQEEGAESIPQAAVKGEGDFVACADGGYNWAARCGISPDAVIGDMDSLSDVVLDAASEAGVTLLTFPKEKDETDTLLCVKHGLSLGYERFRIVGGIGGSLGHTVANLQTLSFLTDMECDAEIVTRRERAFMIDGETVKVAPPGAPEQADIGVRAGRHEKTVTGAPGSMFSVFSYAERSTRVCIEGDARYKLDDTVLTQSFPLGVHNEFTGEGQATVRVFVGFGRLLVIAEAET